MSAHDLDKARDATAWRSLFNQRDLDGWQHVGPGKFWVDPQTQLLRSEGGMGLLWYTREKLGNCVLRVTYRVTKTGSNSGIFIRIANAPVEAMYAVHHGYEVQILDNESSPYHRTGAVYSLAPARGAAMRPTGEWNVMEIVMTGDLVQVRLNGTVVTDFDPNSPAPPRQHDWEPTLGPRPRAGFIGLQNHGGEESEVFFKEVEVAPIAAH